MIIDQVAFSIGPLQIRWYSLSYIFGMIFAYWYIKKIDKYQVFDKESYESVISWWVISVILGGRIGYILFYNLDFYIHFPIEMLKLWNGGMSFHGALVGVMIGMYIFCRKNKIDVLAAFDLGTCAVPVGIFFGRIANFINGELYGKVTDMKVGMIFPASGDLLYRHPSQLYEAFGEGFLLFIITNSLFFFTKVKTSKGMLSSVFCVWYGVIRFSIEFVREPDVQIGYIIFDQITMGQLLSIFMIIMGFYFIKLAKIQNKFSI